MTTLKLSITHFKILHTLKLLNEQKLYPNAEGIHKILCGDITIDNVEFVSSLPTFGCLISYSSKKICHYVLTLNRHGYLKNKYDKVTDDLYLELTIKGLNEVDDFLKKKKTPYKKTTPLKKTVIVKID